jgi:hypothetical protein
MNQRMRCAEFQLDWIRVGDDAVTPHTAVAKSCARSLTHLTIEYDGWSKGDSKHFSGVIRLPLSTVEHEVWGQGVLDPIRPRSGSSGRSKT